MQTLAHLLIRWVVMTAAIGLPVADETLQKSAPSDGKVPSPTRPANQSRPKEDPQIKPAGRETGEPVQPEGNWSDENLPIDLASALQLAGVGNPQILLARQRVLEAMALHQFAAAQFLPSLHAGVSFNNHNGNLIQSDGSVLKVNRGSLYLGAGAMAVGSGTVQIPGVAWSGNVAEKVYTALVARQEVEIREHASRAAENTMLLRTAVAFNELLRAEGLHAITKQNQEDAAELFRLVNTFADSGQGRKPDADRAQSDLSQRTALLPETDGNRMIASARLAELLNLPPTTRLTPLDDKVIPCALVPEPIPLAELLTMAILNRPEMKQRQAAIRQALLNLESSQILPFSPTVIIGFSYGEDGGGSNLVAQPRGTSLYARDVSRFGSFGERADLDVIAYWAAENLGLGNVARINWNRSRLGITEWLLVQMLNRVRMEVTTAYARSHARLAQIATAEKAMRKALEAFTADMKAARGFESRPIEMLLSLRILARARVAYINAIADYNRAQVELFVALGEPPVDVLARNVPRAVATRPVDPPAERKRDK